MRDYNINPMTETEVRELLASGSSGYILLNDINRPAVERMVANGELVLNVKHKIFGRVRGGSVRDRWPRTEDAEPDRRSDTQGCA